MRTRIGMSVLVIALAWPVGAEQLLARLTLDQLQTAAMPAGVAIEAKLVNGEPTAIITNANERAVSVQLAEVSIDKLEDTRLSYEAHVSSENASKPAYLELWAVVKGQAYFSRALNDTFTGTQSARITSTTFFLNAGNPAEAARLGVRFEGPGSVTISGIELWEREGELRPGMWGGVLGGVVGISAGIWACVASWLVYRGRARGVVLGLTATSGIVGAFVMLFGGLAWFWGADWSLWYPCVLVGGIVAVVEGGTYFSLRSRYQQSEERRMLAMDMK